MVSFMNCPRMFVPDTVWNFSAMHEGYRKERFALPAAGQQPKKYLEMCAVYDSEYAHYQILKADDDRRAREIGKLGGLRF